nr:disease resistance protein RGA2-like [Quercus suber]
MTELALSIAENVIKKLGSLAYQEICMSQDIASNLTKFQLNMSTIQAVLMDAEEKQVRNRALSVWLEQLKDVFYDAIDVLDEFECEDLRRKVVETYGNTSEQLYINSASIASRKVST